MAVNEAHKNGQGVRGARLLKERDATDTEEQPRDEEGGHDGPWGGVKTKDNEYETGLTSTPEYGNGQARSLGPRRHKNKIK